MHKEDIHLTYMRKAQIFSLIAGIALVFGLVGFVGSAEADPLQGKISNESPVGRALLGHKVGDIVVVSSPVKTEYKIKSIKYEIN